MTGRVLRQSSLGGLSPCNSAKMVTPGWTDYMTLEKVNGEWKIPSVVQRIDN
jgi:hypothetical protein